MDTGTGVEAPRQRTRQPMSSFMPRSRHEPEIFATDIRPGADAFVYCKGCGVSLPGQARYQRTKAAITTMMCEECQIQHGHALMPMPDTPSFCYRCGGADVIVIEKSFSPVTHHLCPRCVPDRLARYQAGNFRTPHQNRAI